MRMRASAEAVGVVKLHITCVTERAETAHPEVTAEFRGFKDCTGPQLCGKKSIAND